MALFNQAKEDSQTRSSLESLQSLSQKSAVMVALLGWVVIVGWIFDIQVLKGVLPGLIPMKSHTALCFILGGVSLWLWHQIRERDERKKGEERKIDRPIFSFILQGIYILLIFIDLLTSIKYGVNTNWGIHPSLFEPTINLLPTVSPQSMTTYTTLSFIFVGCALLFLSKNRPNYVWAQSFTLVNLAIAGLGCLSYTYGQAYFYQAGVSYTTMGVHTAVAFTILSLAILLARPDRGVMALFTSTNAGGMMARRLFPAAIAIPPLAGWAIVLGYRNNLYTAEMGISLLVIVNVFVVTGVIGWNARTLGFVDRQREGAERSRDRVNEALENNTLQQSNQLRQINQQLQRAVSDRATVEDELEKNDNLLHAAIDNTPDAIFIKDLDGRLVMLNAASARFFGKSINELIGKFSAEFLPPEIANKLTEIERRILTTGEPETVETVLQNQGIPLTYLIKKSVWRDAQGNAIGLIGIGRDISAIKQAETCFTHLATILDATTDFVGVCDLEGHPIYINRAARQLLGLTEKQEISHLHITDFVPESARTHLIEEAVATVLKRGVWSGETVWLTANGRSIRVSQVLLAHKDANGNVEHFSTIARDISEVKQAQEAVQQSWERFDLAVRSTSDGLWDATFFPNDPYNPQNELYYSPRFKELLGYADNEFANIQQSWWSRIHPDDRDRVISAFTAHLERGVPYRNIEYRLQHKDGEYIWISASGQAFWDEWGNAIRMAGSICDISDRKRAEEALRLSERRYRSLAIATTQMVWTTNERGEIVTLQPSWNAYTGQNFEAYKGWGWIEAIHPDDRDRTAQAWNQALQMKTLYEIEHRLRRHDGTYRFFWVRGVPVLTEDGSIHEWVGTHTDITDRKQAEAELRESETRYREQATRLETTLQQLKQTQTQLIQTEKISSLGQLVAGVAHEINNPINFISGNVSHTKGYVRDLLDLITLYQKHYTNPVQEILEHLENIDFDFLIQDLPNLLSSMSVGTERIREIVLSLRNFSRLERGEMKSVDIREGIESTLLILQHRLKATPEHPAIGIIKEYGDLPLVECSPGQLNQVFMNILANAIDALEEKSQVRTTSDGGGILDSDCLPTIYIRTQVVKDNWVAIRVSDNGPGMTEAVRSKLFDAFFTTKPVGKGTGLGLSISYQIVVEKHGGRIACISQPGQGTEFIIEVPISQCDRNTGLFQQA